MKTSDLPEFDPPEKATQPTAPMLGRGGADGALGRTMKRGRHRLLGRFGGENSGGQAYHVMNRAAGGEMVFGDANRMTEQNAWHHFTGVGAQGLDAEPLDLIAAKEVGVRLFRREPNAVKQWPKLT